MEIFLVRHTSVDVPSGYVYGQTDVPLRPTFEVEAEAVKSVLDNYRFDKAWTSPLSRCVRLATYCNYPDAERDDRIKELHFGDWEMTAWNDLETDPRSAGWFADWVNAHTPNGESLMDQYQRVSSLLDEIRSNGYRKVCLFAHGGVLTCARIYAGEYGMEEAFRKIPAYGEVICLHFDN